MVTSYIPNRGDIVWLQFSPQQGKEQAGLRPALVVSPQKYNKLSGLALMCPITSTVKGYPFEVILSATRTIQGCILADQLRSLDWTERNAEFIEKAEAKTLQEVLQKIGALMIYPL